MTSIIMQWNKKKKKQKKDYWKLYLNILAIFFSLVWLLMLSMSAIFLITHLTNASLLIQERIFYGTLLIVGIFKVDFLMIYRFIKGGLE